MDIHVVQPGDTIYRLAQQYGVPMERLLQDNQLENPSQLVVGQTIVVQYPELTHTVRAGDSLYSIAQMHNTTAAQLLRNNPALQGRDLIYPGQTIVVKFASKPRGSLTANAYAYPSIDRDLLRATLPYLHQLTPFTYRFDGDDLIPLRDETLVNAALQSRVAPIFHLSNLDEQERFSPELAHELLKDEDDQEELIQEILAQKDSDPAVVSLLMSMESLFAAIAGALILGNRMTGREYLGCALMLAAGGLELTQTLAAYQDLRAAALPAARRPGYWPSGDTGPNSSSAAAVWAAICWPPVRRTLRRTSWRWSAGMRMNWRGWRFPSASTPLWMWSWPLRATTRW